MKKGRITKIALLACLLVIVLTAFSGCGKQNVREATFLLKNRSEWSEAALREQMAAEKGGVTLLENGEVKATGRSFRKSYCGGGLYGRDA